MIIIFTRKRVVITILVAFSVVVMNLYLRAILAKGGATRKLYHRAVGQEVQSEEVSNADNYPNKKVVAYSYYGAENERYSGGLLANAKALEKEFPGWHMFIYHDHTAAMHVLQKAAAESKLVRVIDVKTRPSTAEVTNRMSWRFLPLEDPTVARFIARDCDSRLTARDKSTVDAWISSGKKFHVVRDHPSHSKFPMSGGMWGGVRGALPNIRQMLRSLNSDAYLADMNFLSDYIWPIAQRSLIQHDAFSCERFGGGLPVPHVREGGEHLGAVYIGGTMRETDVAVLLSAQRPQRCTPPEEYELYGGPVVLLARECKCKSGHGSTYCDKDNGDKVAAGCAHRCKKGPGGNNNRGVCVAY